MSEIRKAFGKHLEKMKPHSYVICLARKGDPDALGTCESPGVPSGHFFPIILEEQFGMAPDAFKKWWAKQSCLAKYEVGQHVKKASK